MGKEKRRIVDLASVGAHGLESVFPDNTYDEVS